MGQTLLCYYINSIRVFTVDLVLTLACNTAKITAPMLEHATIDATLKNLDCYASFLGTYGQIMPIVMDHC